MSKKKHTYTNEIKPKKGFVITDQMSKVNWTTGRDHYVDMPKDFNDRHIMKLWCEQNCQYPVAYFTSWSILMITFNDFNHINSSARVFFFSEDDAVAFKLRWT